MKKSFMTRVLAVSLSTAMAFSVPVVGNFTTAFADTAASSSAALAMSYTQKDAEVGTRMVFSLKGSQASKWKVVRAASSDKAVASISKTTSKKVAVEAQGAGEAKISVRVQKTKDKRQKVLKIKLNITAADPTIASVEQTDAAKLVVTLSKPVESVAAADFAIAKNDEAKTAVAVKSATLDETDKTKVTIETEKGMTDGQVYTVTYTAATEDKTVSTAEFTAQTATVLGVSSVTQTTTTKLTAVFNAEVASPNKADFSLVRDDNKVITIKSVTADATDKTKVTVETYDSLNDAKVYTLTYTAKTESGESVPSTAQFTATNGQIASLGLDKTTVAAGEAEEFKIQTLDAGNVILNEYLRSQAISNNMDVDVTYNGGGYMDGDKLILPNVNDTANVKVTYHTFKYENSVETGVITKDFVITAVAPDKTLAGFDYSIADGTPAWDLPSYKQVARIAVADNNKKVYFRFKNANGVDKTSDYTVESSDDNKLLIAGDPENGCSIYGVSAGTASILVRDKANKSVVATLPITIVAERVASSLELSKTSLTVSNSVNIDPEEVTWKVKDQYGEEMEFTTPASAVVINNTAGTEVLNDDNKVELVSGSSIKVNGNVLGADLAAGKTATYTVTVKATAKGKELEKKLTVVVKAPNPDGAKSYGFAVTGNTDIVVGKDDTANKTVTVKMVEYLDGVANNYVALDDIKVDELTGTKTNLETDVAGNTATIILADQVDDAQGNHIFTKHVTAGKYKVTVVVTNDDKKKIEALSYTLDVKDSQVNPTASVVSKNAEYDTLVSVLNNDSKVKYYCNGSELSKDDTNATLLPVDCNVTGDSGVVKNVMLTYRVGGGVAWLTTRIPVNTTFTNVTSTGL